MTFADLVINCLKETFHNDDKNLTVTALRDGSLAQRAEYASEINNVCLSINKAIARLETAKKIPLKYAVLTANPEQDIYSISTISDLRKIRSVFIMKNGRPYWIGWSMITDKTIYLGYGIEDTIHVVYERIVPLFTESYFTKTTNLTSYGLSDELCNYITYFVKSELFEAVDPDRCKRYLNYFEQFIAEVDTRENIPYQSAARPTYKIR